MAHIIISLICVYLSVTRTEAFLVARSRSNANMLCPTRLWSAAPDSEALQAPADMRLREIQSELKQRKVHYDDCFDRESLMARLTEARENNPIEVPDETSDDIKENVEPETTSDNKDEVNAPGSSNPSDTSLESFDREATLAELRTQRIKTLREQLSKYNVRWGNMIEKEDLVKTLCDAMEDRFLRSQNFSRSGEVLVGEVYDSNEEVLIEELGWLESDISKGVSTPVPDESKPTSHAPLLLDVYATW